MEQITHDELKKIVEGRDFESLIGRAENIFFESRLEKYEVGKESEEAWKKGNLELAKDVYVFANSNGGIILIGLGKESPKSVLEIWLRKLIVLMKVLQIQTSMRK
jgi:predicted HTH transcriptional regulator